MTQQRRRFFRLRLPLRERFAARITGHRYLIRELSEGGMRVVSAEPRETALPLGQRVSAELMLHDGNRLTIQGTVHRRDGEEWVIVDLEGISFARMLEEQRRLVRKYPFL